MAANTVDKLREWVDAQPDKTIYTFLADGGNPSDTLTYRDVDRRARAIAASLQSLRASGRPVLLWHPPGLEFVCGFLGCLYAGAIAVPVPTPHTSRGIPRALGIAADANPAAALTTASLLGSATSTLAEVLPSSLCVATDALPDSLAAKWRDPALTSSDLALLQYTSGSTCEPRGVMVSQGNLLHNMELVRECFGQSRESRGMIWLPHYHDMGLFGGVLQAGYVGGSVILMPPAAFFQHPVRWLHAISRFRATDSGGPNFAYDLCVEKTTPEQLAGIDLSSWQVAFNGAEQVRLETIDRFCARFRPSGFRREAMYPCFGLAESTLIVAGGERLTAAETTARDGATRVSSGRALSDEKILIVDPDKLTPVAPRQVGEIWVSSPSVAQGYWNRRSETEQTFRARTACGEGPFLRTGDLGFLDAGNLYLTGRLKDVIVIDGSNHYPQDIEYTIERACSFPYPGSVAAFGCELGGRERLIVMAEIRHRPRNGDASIAAEVRRAVARHHDLRVHDVLLVRPGGIPRTTSGKIQHYLCRMMYLEQSPVRADV